MFSEPDELTTKYVCLDLSQRNQVLISQWSLMKDDDNDCGEISQQRSYNTRYGLPSPMFGKAMAKLHSSNKHLNLMFRQWSTLKMESLFRKNHLHTILCCGNPNDNTVQLVKQYGTNVCSTMMDNIIHNYRCSVQDKKSQPSVMKKLMIRRRQQKQQRRQQKQNRLKRKQRTNMMKMPMAMAKSKLSSLRNNSSSSVSYSRINNSDPGNDYSSSHNDTTTKSTEDQMNLTSGQMGRDVGMTFTFPLACALSYAIQGQPADAQAMIQSLNHFWYMYSAKLIDNEGMDEEFVRNVYRHAIGWCGWFLYVAYYRMAAYMDVLPLSVLLTYEDKEYLLDSIGVLGIKLMYLGFYSSKGHSGGMTTKQHDDQYDYYYTDTDMNNFRTNNNNNNDDESCCCWSLEQLSEQLGKSLREEVGQLLDVALLNGSTTSWRYQTSETMKIV